MRRIYLSFFPLLQGQDLFISIVFSVLLFPFIFLYLFLSSFISTLLFIELTNNPIVDENCVITIKLDAFSSSLFPFILDAIFSILLSFFRMQFSLPPYWFLLTFIQFVICTSDHPSHSTLQGFDILLLSSFLESIIFFAIHLFELLSTI